MTHCEFLVFVVLRVDRVLENNILEQYRNTDSETIIVVSIHQTQPNGESQLLAMDSTIS